MRVKGALENIAGPEQPAWSPEDSMIAFDASNNGGARVDIYTIHPDGSRLQKLPIAVRGSTEARRIRLTASTSPSTRTPGRRTRWSTAYTSPTPTVATGGGSPRASGPEQAFDTGAIWSPDGRRIAFTRVRDQMQAAIFVVDSDGRHLKRLTAWRTDSANPDWSPDGSKIAYDTYFDVHPGKSANLVTMRPDGTEKTFLTHFKGGDTNAFGPSRSPSGHRIVWHKVGAKVNQLFVMSARGEHNRQLTHVDPAIGPSSPSGPAISSAVLAPASSSSISSSDSSGRSTSPPPGSPGNGGHPTGGVPPASSSARPPGSLRSTPTRASISSIPM